MIGREILLYFAANDLSLAVNELKKGNHSSLCRELYDDDDYYPQIRFTSAKEYNLELVCSGYEQQPVLIDERQLPVFVKKSSVSSGFIIADFAEPSYVELSSLGRTVMSYVDASKYSYSFTTLDKEGFSSGPLSNCQAFNALCCDLEVEAGEGEKVDSATDCPKSCYPSCQFRPVLLSFNSRPAAIDRKVSIRSGESITFAYVLTTGKSELEADSVASDSSVIEKLQHLLTSESKKTENDSLPLSVLVNFGDGKSFNSQNLHDSFDHMYTCLTSRCYYQAQLIATDAKGVSLAGGGLGTITVEVRN